MVGYENFASFQEGIPELSLDDLIPYIPPASQIEPNVNQVTGGSSHGGTDENGQGLYNPKAQEGFQVFEYE